MLVSGVEVCEGNHAEILRHCEPKQRSFSGIRTPTSAVIWESRIEMARFCGIAGRSRAELSRIREGDLFARLCWIAGRNESARRRLKKTVSSGGETGATGGVQSCGAEATPWVEPGGRPQPGPGVWGTAAPGLSRCRPATVDRTQQPAGGSPR